MSRPIEEVMPAEAYADQRKNEFLRNTDHYERHSRVSALPVVAFVVAVTLTSRVAPHRRQAVRALKPSLRTHGCKSCRLRRAAVALSVQVAANSCAKSDIGP